MPKYLFEEDQLTCTALEDELNVLRGSIVSLTVYSSGAVEVETKEVWTSSGQQLIRNALAQRGLPHGKKGKE